MCSDLKDSLIKLTGAPDILHIKDIQSLWSGYGVISRYRLLAEREVNVVVKQVSVPEKETHPRGWSGELSNQRKLKSYGVELAFYKRWAHDCDRHSRVPTLLHSIADDWKVKEKGVGSVRTQRAISSEFQCIMVLEDLDDSGFPVRVEQASLNEVRLCLAWLTNFHSVFMRQEPEGLWPIGTYWHLSTRPDELKNLTDLDLKAVAVDIDRRLNDCHYQSFVHGDAKLANFCFSDMLDDVAAVDFQYVGGGCGMKDVAYFLGSCLTEEDCEAKQSELLSYYFSQLHRSLQQRIRESSERNIKCHFDEDDIDLIIEEWRSLYSFAVADFHRFIKGWSPGHWKINGYSERIAHQVVTDINKRVV